MKTNNDFVSSGTAASYQFKIGKNIASSLSGFIAGAVVASIIWVAVAYVTNILR